MNRPLPPQQTRASAKFWAKPGLLVCFLLLLFFTFQMPSLGFVFEWMFPELDRPIYLQASFAELLLTHLWIVALSSLVSVVVGIALGIFVTRHPGYEFRSLVETTVAMGQTFPPVAVLAIAAPLIGFGAAPALIALALYGLLPVVQATIAGFTTVAANVKDAAVGLGMTPMKRLQQIELPLAFPVILAGIRTSVTINIGTAAIASTVGTQSLGTPIIIGLTGFNTAYVIQGAIVVGLLAINIDLLFEHLQKLAERRLRLGTH